MIDQKETAPSKTIIHHGETNPKRKNYDSSRVRSSTDVGVGEKRLAGGRDSPSRKSSVRKRSLEPTEESSSGAKRNRPLNHPAILPPRSQPVDQKGKEDIPLGDGGSKSGLFCSLCKDDVRFEGIQESVLHIVIHQKIGGKKGTAFKFWKCSDCILESDSVNDFRIHSFQSHRELFPIPTLLMDNFLDLHKLCFPSIHIRCQVNWTKERIDKLNRDLEKAEETEIPNFAGTGKFLCRFDSLPEGISEIPCSLCGEKCGNIRESIQHASTHQKEKEDEIWHCSVCWKSSTTLEHGCRIPSSVKASLIHAKFLKLYKLCFPSLTNFVYHTKSKFLRGCP